MFRIVCQEGIWSECSHWNLQCSKCSCPDSWPLRIMWGLWAYFYVSLHWYLAPFLYVKIYTGLDMLRCMFLLDEFCSSSFQKECVVFAGICRVCAQELQRLTLCSTNLPRFVDCGQGSLIDVIEANAGALPTGATCPTPVWDVEICAPEVITDQYNRWVLSRCHCETTRCVSCTGVLVLRECHILQGDFNRCDHQSVDL